MFISKTRMTTITNKATRILAAAVALCLLTMLALLLVPEPMAAQQAEVTPLMSKDLPELPGKEVTMITVVYPPARQTPSIGTMRMRLSTCWKAPLSCR